MADGERRPVVLIDANILIDYRDSDRRVLGLVCKHLYQLVVPDLVVAEVMNLPAERLLALDIQVVDTPLAVLEVAASRGGALSTQDWVCLELAQANSWACATNDIRLRRECATRRIRAIWGLELMVGLHARGAITAAAAERTARKMHRANPNSITTRVLADFLEVLHGE